MKDIATRIYELLDGKDEKTIREILLNVENRRRQDIEDEFNRIAVQLVRQGDVDVLCDQISLEAKKSFIESWHEELEERRKDYEYVEVKENEIKP